MCTLLEYNPWKSFFFLIKTFDVCLEYLYLQTNVNLNFKKALLILIKFYQKWKKVY
jgi:hypothetical protein